MGQIGIYMKVKVITELKNSSNRKLQYGYLTQVIKFERKYLSSLLGSYNLSMYRLE